MLWLSCWHELSVCFSGPWPWKLMSCQIHDCSGARATMCQLGYDLDRATVCQSQGLIGCSGVQHGHGFGQNISNSELLHLQLR
jgi:hypothetical protein